MPQPPQPALNQPAPNQAAALTQLLRDRRPMQRVFYAQLSGESGHAPAPGGPTRTQTRHCKALHTTTHAPGPSAYILPLRERRGTPCQILQGCQTRRSSIIPCTIN
eukprot:6663583-Prymnesium_polylepis.1